MSKNGNFFSVLIQSKKQASHSQCGTNRSCHPRNHVQPDLLVMSHEKEEYLGVPTTLLNNLVSCIHGFKNSFNLVVYYNIYISHFKNFVHICKILI